MILMLRDVLMWFLGHKGYLDGVECCLKGVKRILDCEQLLKYGIWLGCAASCPIKTSAFRCACLAFLHSKQQSNHSNIRSHPVIALNSQSLIHTPKKNSHTLLTEAHGVLRLKHFCCHWLCEAAGQRTSKAKGDSNWLQRCPLSPLNRQSQRQVKFHASYPLITLQEMNILALELSIL